MFITLLLFVFTLITFFRIMSTTVSLSNVNFLRNRDAVFYYATIVRIIPIKRQPANNKEIHRTLTILITIPSFVLTCRLSTSSAYREHRVILKYY